MPRAIAPSLRRAAIATWRRNPGQPVPVWVDCGRSIETEDGPAGRPRRSTSPSGVPRRPVGGVGHAAGRPSRCPPNSDRPALQIESLLSPSGDTGVLSGVLAVPGDQRLPPRRPQLGVRVPAMRIVAEAGPDLPSVPPNFGPRLYPAPGDGAGASTRGECLLRIARCGRIVIQHLRLSANVRRGRVLAANCCLAYSVA